MELFKRRSFFLENLKALRLATSSPMTRYPAFFAALPSHSGQKQQRAENDKPNAGSADRAAPPRTALTARTTVSASTNSTREAKNAANTVGAACVQFMSIVPRSVGSREATGHSAGISEGEPGRLPARCGRIRISATIATARIAVAAVRLTSNPP
jgi:hypothetical protein